MAIPTDEQQEQMRILSDAVRNADKANIQRPGSLITIKDGLGNVLHQGLHNKVIVSGSAFTMMKHYNIDVPTRTPSYNTVLGLENTLNTPNPEPGVRRDEVVCLFAVGVGGCGQEQHQVYDVDYSKWIKPSDLVPFRYITPPNDLSDLDRTRYFGRALTNGKIAYYFKAFDTEPELIQRYVDGTPIDANVFDSTNTLEIESFVQLKLKITVDDCREWFASTTGLDTAKINAISLLTGYKHEINGYIYYESIRPLTVLHFPSEPLNEYTKSLDITYLCFY
jgi:hypothetical protein